MSRRPRDAKAERRLRWIVPLGALLIRALAATWRVRLVNGDYPERLRAERKPVVFALWHGHLLPLLMRHRYENVSILISEHRDGEIIARIAERIGYRTVRGSTTRGGERALLGLARVLQEGGDIAVTPDGPRGPAREFAPGALVAAQRGGGTILPIAASANRAWRLRSWDRFLIPKPFARVTVAYATPTPVEAPSARAAAALAPRFQALLDEAVALADA
ncbi:MAG TPA: lysophospholipid acyltransferase family protein [Gemmatimonadaceae bacterium]